MNETEIRTENSLKSKALKVGIVAAALVIAFLIGFIPMWMKANTAAAEHEVTKKTLVRTEISNLISDAIVDARRGEYESARQETSDFYTKLNAEIEKGETSAYPTAQNESLKSAFANRDAIITLLAQRDPASVERLTDIYLIYRQAVGESIIKSSPPTSANTNVNSQ